MSRSFRLRGDDNFIVMATDGLWEVINPKACIAIINQLINQYSLEVEIMNSFLILGYLLCFVLDFTTTRNL